MNNSIIERRQARPPLPQACAFAAGEAAAAFPQTHFLATWTDSRLLYLMQSTGYRRCELSMGNSWHARIIAFRNILIQM